MSYEDQVRRDLEQAAKEQQAAPCPVEDDIDAAFAMKAKGGRKAKNQGVYGGLGKAAAVVAKIAAPKRKTYRLRKS